jgi:hypothetical protein
MENVKEKQEPVKTIAKLNDNKTFKAVKIVGYTAGALLLMGGSFKLLAFVFSSFNEMKKSLQQ